MIRIQNFIFILWKFLEMSKLVHSVLKISWGQMPQMPPGCTTAQTLPANKANSQANHILCLGLSVWFLTSKGFFSIETLPHVINLLFRRIQHSFWQFIVEFKMCSCNVPFQTSHKFSSYCHFLCNSCVSRSTNKLYSLFTCTDWLNFCAILNALEVTGPSNNRSTDVRTKKLLFCKTRDGNF